MARLAVERNWQLGTQAQEQAITDEFRGMLVRTYASALVRYSGERVVFKPLRAVASDAEVTVRSELKQTGKERTTLDYDMIRTPAGWRIYNVKFADVCLVSTYRDIFAEKVRHGGVDGLIKFLADENSGGGSRFNSIKTSFWEKSRVMYAIFQDIFRSGLR
jgi:phospholipid transport system substrate-binding protein